MREIITFDVFTDTPFLGNPLAIMPDAAGLSTDQMQTLARELNLSETIFVMPPENPAHRAKVRIFFPTAEIPFAGHPTIGCAIYLSGLTESRDDSVVEMVLEEAAGPVPVTVQRVNGVVSAEFCAPVLPQLQRTLDDIALTARALGLEAGEIGNAIVATPEVWEAGPSYLLIPVATRAALARARPMGAHWEKLTDQAQTISAWLFVPDDTHGFRARMFSPAGGIPEDPATGSAVVTFAGLLAHHGHCTGKETPFSVLQGVEMGRRSEIKAVVAMTDGQLSQVRIGGTAVAISSGRIKIPDDDVLSVKDA
ncbi:MULTISPECIES: PhzF family phenazine biosynthesis protein [unclassified Yoonia]|uniref:PhzF family phenazine biosynthesis protein n=1 Tax=unclassified Yoonia TaxID=2629118 RepID=UPI002AFE4FBC|nr:MULTISPECIES: PhzF family phenazine biosynthesis protein [unclassified Yoonia]